MFDIFCFLLMIIEKYLELQREVDSLKFTRGSVIGSFKLFYLIPFIFLANSPLVFSANKKSELHQREDKILKLRFGIDGTKRYTFAEIGQMYDLSEERIRRIQVSNLRELREISKSSLFQYRRRPLDSK